MQTLVGTVQALVSIEGDAVTLATLVSKVDDTLADHLSKFVLPTPPDRLKLQCMRQGGPLTAANRNPMCRAANQKVAFKSANSWSDIPIAPQELEEVRLE
jgi:hypothetical protein